MTPPGPPLRLILISNSAPVARDAGDMGIDRVMVDLEYRGKVERQSGRDTHLSSHTIDDVARMAAAVSPPTELLVRVDPWGPDSPDQIEQVLAYQPSALMLPMFTTAGEVEAFVGAVDGRCRTILLVETVAAVEAIDEIVGVDGVDELHVGLNDLHIDSGKRFMFEHLVDGLAERVVDAACSRTIPCGIGGVARVGEGVLRSELILGEHVRLRSSGVILSRTFMRGLDTDEQIWSREAADRIRTQVSELRRVEAELRGRVTDEIENDHAELCAMVHSIAEQQTVETTGS